jgi:hypothetical protein
MASGSLSAGALGTLSLGVSDFAGALALPLCRCIACGIWTSHRIDITASLAVARRGEKPVVNSIANRSVPAVGR